VKQALWIIAVLVAGCSDAANTQYVPIGSRCTASNSCGTSPFDCRTSGYPGGYCEKPCATDGDCPADSICGLVLDGARSCRRRCSGPSQCRQNEGYTCVVLPMGSVCDLPSIVDGGQ
jgi:hypothetical protein